LRVGDGAKPVLITLRESSLFFLRDNRRMRRADAYSHRLMQEPWQSPVKAAAGPEAAASVATKPTRKLAAEPSR
jgi:hypothetical protein